MRRRLRQAYQDFMHLRLGRPRLKVGPEDGLLVSWPRSGNTWMRYMLAYAVLPEGQWDLLSIEDRFPIVDRLDFARVLRRIGPARPRIFKSHELFRPYYLRGRVVYLVRDPRDAILSFYNYRRKLTGLEITWERFLRESLAGRLRYGSWQGHVGGWLAHRDAQNMLVIRYEQMLADPAASLGAALEHYRIEVPPRRIEQAVERSSVEHVNKGFARYARAHGKQFDGGLGGGSGRGRAAFSDADRALLRERAGELIERLGYDA